MVRRTLIVALALVATGCGRAPQAATSMVPTAFQARAAQTKAEFVAAAKSKGVKLSEADLAMIQAERQVTPNGTWAARPAEHRCGRATTTDRCRRTRSWAPT